MGRSRASGILLPSKLPKFGGDDGVLFDEPFDLTLLARQDD
jgi:hypothetical protein